MSRPLEDVRILDLTWVLAGPFASMVLCDLGADVVKVERPPAGDISRTTGPYQNGWSGYFFSINRGSKASRSTFGTRKARRSSSAWWRRPMS